MYDVRFNWIKRQGVCTYISSNVIEYIQFHLYNAFVIYDYPVYNELDIIIICIYFSVKQ